jgi:uncharacterized protein (DUF1919 family)
MAVKFYRDFKGKNAYILGDSNAEEKKAILQVIKDENKLTKFKVKKKYTSMQIKRIINVKYKPKILLRRKPYLFAIRKVPRWIEFGGSGKGRIRYPALLS